jgi:FKBP-type peptidyl-prolyl cis-trans isomerase FkpA
VPSFPIWTSATRACPRDRSNRRNGVDGISARFLELVGFLAGALGPWPFGRLLEGPLKSRVAESVGMVGIGGVVVGPYSMEAGNVLPRAMVKTHRTGLVLLLLTAGLSSAACGRLGGGSSPDPKTDDEKVFYALGLDIGKNIGVFALQPNEVDLVKSGLGDSVSGKKPKVDLEAIRPKIFEMARKRQEAKAGVEKKRGKDLLVTAAKEPGAQQLPSGLVIKTLKPGSGPSPTESDTVKVHYEGKLTDGTVFDSSYKRNQPAEFPLRGVVKCWTEGLQKMKVGEKALLTCPSEIAYGDQGRPPTIPGGATLIFTVELIEIVVQKPAAVAVPPPAPPTAAKPTPAPAKK